jgi:hypothetical protein
VKPLLRPYLQQGRQTYWTLYRLQQPDEQTHMKIYPLPEVLDGHSWKVEPGTGSCDTVSRILSVPLTPSASDRFVRNHEMGHARITPRHSAAALATRYGLSTDSMQVVEDARVHHFLRRAGVDCCGSLSPAEMDAAVEASVSNTRRIGLLLVASLSTDDFARAVDSLKKRLSEEELRELLGRVELVEQRLLAARNVFRPIGFRNGTAPAAKLFDALFPTDSCFAEPQVPIVSLSIRPGSSRSVKWGSLVFESLPLALSRRVVPQGSRRCFRDEGSAMTAPYRMCVDGRVFCRKQKSKGGTVLVDGSGSMSLSPLDIERIVAAAPASTVAVYCGSGTRGTLTVLAEHGRVVNREGLLNARRSNGNVVDGPALEWLGKQSEPRVWVSDGFVTGQHDRPDIDLAADAERLCRTYRITRVERSQAVTALLTASHA